MTVCAGADMVDKAQAAALRGTSWRGMRRITCLLLAEDTSFGKWTPGTQLNKAGI